MATAAAPLLEDGPVSEAPAIEESPPPPAKLRDATAAPVEPTSSQARELGRRLGMTVSVADVLYRRGFREPADTRAFLEPRLSNLTDPTPMADRAAAADRLAHAIQQRQSICVFGDYDCDGITSAAILTQVLRALGGRVTPLLASRFDGGYGVSPAAVKRILAANPTVLVTCDCGSSDHAALAEVGARGVDVIVVDHHLVPDEPLPALAFLNPHRPDCGFAYKGMASCGLVLSVGAAVRRALGQELDLRRWMDLVAIGTIGDVAPLGGDNRALVRAGLRALRTAERPGIRALLTSTKLRGAAITGEDVAFRLAPRINAPGRLGAPDTALQLLLADTTEAAHALAAEIDQMTLERRALQQAMIDEALTEIRERGWDQRPALVVGRPGWSHGIVGIVAGRLADEFGVPTIVVGFEGETGRGSVRGPQGARLHDALTRVSGCLERFGGHQAAAGVEVRPERLDELRQQFESACAAQPTEAVLGPAPIPLCPEDDPSAVARDLLKLEPCGHENPTPRFVTSAAVARAKSVKGGHLKLDLDLPGDGPPLAAFAPFMGDRADGLGDTVTVTGKIRLNRWRGATTTELLVEEIGPGG